MDFLDLQEQAIVQEIPDVATGMDSSAHEQVIVQEISIVALHGLVVPSGPEECGNNRCRVFFSRLVRIL